MKGNATQNGVVWSS